MLNLLGRGSGETYSVFLLPIEQAFGWTRSQLTSVYSLYLLIGALIAPLVGTLFDRLGPRLVYLGGIAALSAAYLLASTLSTVVEFYLYVGVGIGLGVALVGMVPASGMLVRWYRHGLASALGLAFAAAGCGTLLFVPLAQYLLEHSDWRAAYRVLGFTMLAALPVAAFALPWKRFTAGRAEYRVDRGAPGTEEGWTLRLAIGTPVYRGLAAMFLLTSIGMFIVVPQTVAYLIDLGLSPMVAASAFGVTAMLSTFSVAFTGIMADRVGPRVTVSASFIGSCTGILVLFLMSFRTLPELLALFVVMFGLCQGVRGPIISSICAKKFAGRRVATIYGTLYSINAIGAAIGSLAGGLLHDATGGYRVGFVVAFCSLALASLPMWMVRELREFR